MDADFADGRERVGGLAFVRFALTWIGKWKTTDGTKGTDLEMLMEQIRLIHQVIGSGNATC